MRDFTDRERQAMTTAYNQLRNPPLNIGTIQDQAQYIADILRALMFEVIDSCEGVKNHNEQIIKTETRIVVRGRALIFYAQTLGQAGYIEALLSELPSVRP